MSVFLESFPEDAALSLLRRINSALIAYSESSSPATDFMIRSYKRRYGGGDENSRQLLSRGIHLNGSLAAILQNMKREYKSVHMHAFADMFAIPRWQASVLLDLHKERRL